MGSWILRCGALAVEDSKLTALQQCETNREGIFNLQFSILYRPRFACQAQVSLDEPSRPPNLEHLPGDGGNLQS